MTTSQCPNCKKNSHRKCVNPTQCPCSVCRRLKWSKPPGITGTWFPDEQVRKALINAAREAVPGSGDEWAEIWTFKSASTAYSSVTRVKQGIIKGLDRGQWDARAAKTPTGTKVWMRYIGD